MATFPLQIVTMDGMEYTGDVERITLRTIHGDVAILARHINYCTAIGMGTAVVRQADGTERSAACIGGMLSVMNGVCRVFPTTWEWSEEIDVDRAKRAKEAAEQKLKEAKLTKEARVKAEARLYRSLVRLSTAGRIKH